MHKPIAYYLAALVLASSAAAAPEPANLETQLQHAWNIANELGKREENAIRKDPVAHAKGLYRLEHRAVALHEMAGHAAFESELARERFRDDAETLLMGIHDMQGRMLSSAVDRLNTALPGKDGAQHLTQYDGQDVYQPNYRSSLRLTQQERRERLADMQHEFLEQGGNPGDIKTLDEAFIAALVPGQLAEWVRVASRFRATTAGANHPIIAGGRSVRGAGGLKVWRDPSGAVSLAIVSNWSGNYKPGVSVNLALMNHLHSLGIPRNRMLLTGTTPDDPVIVGLHLKASGIPKEQIKAELAQLKEKAETDVQQIRAGIRPPPRVRMGRSISRPQQRR